MSTTTNVSTLKINYLTQEQYDTALSNNQINENEIYLTPAEDTPISSVVGQTTTSKWSGSIQFTIAVPSGYTLLGSAPYCIYCSGNDNCYVTDNSASMVNGNIKIDAYVHNTVSANIIVVARCFIIRNDIVAS